MRATFLASVLAAIAACSPYSPDLPSQPFLCGTTAPQCPDGFTCTDSGSNMVCVKSSGGGGPDAGSGIGSCSNDSTLEPNDTIQTAFPTPVASQRASLDLTSLAICPAGDKDNYKFNTTVNLQNADATVTYDSAGAPLQMSILSSGGSSLVNAVSTANGVIKAHIANLPVDTYYVQVFAASGTNNYSLSLAVSGP